jgi:hypothetical protein
MDKHACNPATSTDSGRLFRVDGPVHSGKPDVCAAVTITWAVAQHLTVAAKSISDR